MASAGSRSAASPTRLLELPEANIDSQDLPLTVRAGFQKRAKLKNKIPNIAWASPKMADDEGLADRYQVLEELGRESHR